MICSSYPGRIRRHLHPTGWWLIAALLILIGIIGSLLPSVPGVILVFSGMLLNAWIDGSGASVG